MPTTNPTKLYVIGGILVEGTKSEGGAFYNIKIVKTAMTGRYLAKIFEANAKEVKNVEPNSDSRVRETNS